MKDTDENTRQLAAELAADLQDDQIVTALCAATYDPSPKVSKAALRSLEKVRPELHKQLSTLLSNASYTNRRKAIDEIAVMGAKGRPAVPTLAVMAAMPFPTTTTASGQRDLIEGAVLAISSLGVTDEAVAEVLAKVATGRASPPSRTAAAQALENWAKEETGSEKQLFVVLTAWFDINEDYQVRACEVAGRHGEKGKKEFEATLTRLKQSKSQKVQDAAKASLELLNK